MTAVCQATFHAPGTPIRALPANKRAPEEQELLVDALEEFVNLGDTLDEYKEFGAANGKFFPVIVWDKATKRDLSWDPACHLLAVVYRDLLRKVWNEPLWRNAALKVLLGIDFPFFNWTQESPGEINSFLDWANRLGAAGLKAVGFSEDWRQMLRALAAVHAEYSARSFKALPGIEPDAMTGTLNYEPANDFQAAVYILFRAIWKAKTCPQCGCFFVAGKQAQLYCSVQCHAKVKRERDRQFWKQKGNSLRKTRRASSKS